MTPRFTLLALALVFCTVYGIILRDLLREARSLCDEMDRMYGDRDYRLLSRSLSTLVAVLFAVPCTVSWVVRFTLAIPAGLANTLENVWQRQDDLAIAITAWLRRKWAKKL